MTNLKKIISISAASCMLMLTGCYPTGEKAIADTDLSSLLEKAEAIENFSIEELKLPQNNPQSVPSITLKYKDWDEDSINESLLDDREITEQKEYPSDSFESESYKLEYIDEGYFICWESGRLLLSPYYEDENYSEEQLKQIHRSQICSKIDCVYSEELLSAPDLELFSRASVVARANELLTNLGIESLSEPSVYAISADYANSLYDDVTWTVNDEAYYIVYSQCFEELTLPKSSISIGDEKALSNYVKIIISKDKILDLKCNDIFDSEYISGENAEIKFDAENALDTLIGVYQNQTLKTEHIFYSCELVYIPTEVISSKEFRYRPAWYFQGRCKTESTDEITYIAEIVYADTGVRYVSVH